MRVYYIGPPEWGPVVINADSFDPALHIEADKKVEPRSDPKPAKRGRPRKLKEA